MAAFEPPPTGRLWVPRDTEIIEHRYFDGQRILFPHEAERLNALVTLIEMLIGDYNQDLASRLQEQQTLLSKDGALERDLASIVDLTVVARKIDGPANDRVAHIVDFAKVDALRMIGETEQAATLAGRHSQ